ncbi:flavin reductase [Leifsonia kafniensis]|uniref:Flavin reductase n=1 Tax=Leifsonia kafniensis TaxID=475957 RepID=A0ABP7KN05_9MICO
MSAAPTTSESPTGAAPVAKSWSTEEWWRTALGEYPTGVTLITALDAEGQPVGMVVGTFSAVSQQPPMVGYLATSTSETFGHVMAGGRFVASVLSAGHEELCRVFATKQQDRFEHGEWQLTASGIPRLVDAVAWFSADINNVVAAGDHTMVIGDVEEFGVGDGRGGLPLLFLKGGYGSFQVHSLRFDYRELGIRQRLADGMRQSLEAFAAQERIGCALATASGDAVVMLAVCDFTDHEDASTRDGRSFAFAAPVAPVLAAWAAPSVQKVWIEGARHLLGKVDRPRLAEMLTRVRNRGYAVSLGNAVATSFNAQLTANPLDRATLATLWSEIDRELGNLEHSPAWHEEVSSIQLPVFNRDGTADMELVVACERGLSRADFEALLAGARELAARLSALMPPA